MGMTHTQRHQNKFSEALKKSRTALGISQEGFSLVSSRTYVSSLERGLKSPTLSKIDALSEVLGIHPLTLLTLTYMNEQQIESANTLFDLISKELISILNAEP